MAFCAHMEFPSMPPSADRLFHSIFIKNNNIFLKKTAEIEWVAINHFNYFFQLIEALDLLEFNFIITSLSLSAIEKSSF